MQGAAPLQRQHRVQTIPLRRLAISLRDSDTRTESQRSPVSSHAECRSRRAKQCHPIRPTKLFCPSRASGRYLAGFHLSVLTAAPERALVPVGIASWKRQRMRERYWACAVTACRIHSRCTHRSTRTSWRIPPQIGRRSM